MFHIIALEHVKHNWVRLALDNMDSANLICTQDFAAGAGVIIMFMRSTTSIYAPTRTIPPRRRVSRPP
jgi:hypothetical protein